MLLPQWKKIIIVALIFFLLLFFAYRRVVVRAQESGSLSPTPVQLLTPTIPLINQETLAYPEAFKLDQQIKQVTRELFKALTSGSQLSAMENKAVQRKNLMKQAISKYPYVFLGNALTPSDADRFDHNLQSYFEKPQTLSNVELEVVYNDDFQNYKNTRLDYSLHNLFDHTHSTFYPSGEFAGHISGTTLNINGVVLDQEVAARVMAAPQVGGGGNNNNDPIPTNVEILQEASPDTLGPQRVAIILVKPKGATFQPYYSKEEIEELILRGEVNKFFKETSYGKMWLDEEKSKAYGWYEVEGLTLNTQDGGNLKNRIIQMTDSDINYREFDRVLLGMAINSGEIQTKENYWGWSDLGKKEYTTNAGNLYFSVGVFGVVKGAFELIVHELGHGLGLYHANGLECDKGSLEQYCHHEEYGNAYDAMGRGRLDYNAYFKEVLGWLNTADQTLIDIVQSGSYVLGPLEEEEGVAAKVHISDLYNSPIYYVEYRKSKPLWGKEDDVIGLNINWRFMPLATRLLHMQSPWYGGGPSATLKEGNTFIDQRSGISITNLGTDTANGETTINVELKTIPCQYHDFAVNLKNISLTLLGFSGLDMPIICNDNNCVVKRKKRQEAIVWFVFDIMNLNTLSCPDVLTRAAVYTPWGEKPAFSQYSTFLSGGKMATLAVPVYIKPEIPAGTYQFDTLVENEKTGAILFSTPKMVEIIEEKPILEGDLNGDYKVDIFDLVLVAREFGKRRYDKRSEPLTPSADLDFDGDVDIFDLVIVAKNFGKKAKDFEKYQQY